MKAPVKPAFVCASCARMLRAQPPLRPLTASIPTAASFATSAQDNANASPSSSPPIDPQLPRYRQTPPAMKMPYRLRPQPKQPAWRVNADPQALDAAYDRMLGRIGGQDVRGHELLDEQTKWLALTHKSFDHGRQGFNDRLAFLGKRVVELQASLTLLNAPSANPAVEATGSSSSSSSSSNASATTAAAAAQDEVFLHPALDGVENVTAFAKHATLAPARLAQLAGVYGLDRVVRWKPKKSDNLQGSGADVVMAQALYSVIGALAMRQGGEVAGRAARERILQPLGLR